MVILTSPILNFEDGVLTDIDFVAEDGENGADLAQFGLLNFSFGDLSNVIPGGDRLLVEIDVELAAVPLPAGMTLMLTALGAAAFVSRKRTKAST